jgi:PAS domain S-box-containing protein
MKDDYKILLVDDSESDRGICRRYLLADEDFDYQIIEAESLEEGLALWRSRSPDLVLTDIHLPDGSGLELLTAIKKTHPRQKFPVIMMTGQGDERLAVQAMKLGASDYLVKDDITASTLCHYVEKAIDQWKLSGKLTRLRQQVETKNTVLQFKDDIFRAIFDNTFQFIGLLTPDGMLLEANQTALTVGGLQREDVVGCLFWETNWFKISRDTQEKLEQSVIRAAKGEFIRYEVDVWGANQRVITIDFSLRPVFNESGQVSCIIPEGRDITDQKEAELLLRQQALVFENITDGVIITDMDGIIIDWNRGAENLYGYTKAEILGQSPSILHRPEEAERLSTKIIQTTLQKGSWSGEFTVICKDGTEKITATSTVLLQDATGKNIALIGLNHDITNLKTAKEELRQSNEQLQQLNQELEARVEERTYELENSESFNRSILETIPDLLLRLGRDGTCLSYISPKVQRENFEPISQHISEFLPPDLLERQLQAIEQALVTGELQVYEHQVLKNNQIAYEEIRILAINNQEVLVIVRDISDRKQTEIALRESEEFNRQLITEFPIGLASCHLDGQLVYVNPNFAKILGRTVEETLNLTYWDITPIKYQEQEAEQLRQLQETGSYGPYEKEYIHKDGHLVAVSLTGLLIKQNGETLIWSSVQDISDRKQAEIDLKESEQHYVSLMAAAPVGIFRTDAMGHCTYVNDRWCRISGLTLKSAMGDGWRQGIYPEDRQSVTDEWYRSVQEDQPFSLEYRFQRLDGVVTWVYGQSVAKLDADGIVTGYVGTITDISDRKLVEQALKQQLTAIEAAIDGIAILQNNEYIYLNQSHLEMYGCGHPDELLGKSWTELYSLEEITRFGQDIFPVLQRDRSWRGEAIATRKDGSTFVEELSLTITEEGLLICVCRDISDRKQAEQTIRQQIEKETLLRQITQHIRETLDLQTIFETACQDIRQFIQSDRVGIFRFYLESGFDDGAFVAESVKEGLSSVLSIPIHDHCFGADYAQRYTQGHFQAVNDVLQSDLQDCHKAVLTQFQIRANLVIPLLIGEELWGLLCIHTCDAPRIWQPDEIDLIQQIAGQLAIAIQQGDLYNQIHTELIARHLAEEKILLELRRKQLLGEIIQSVRDSLDITEILVNVTQKTLEILHCDRVIVFQLFPDGKSKIVEESVSDQFASLKNLHLEDEVWNQEVLDCYWQGIPRIVPDVMNDRWTDCLVEYSTQGQIQSKIVAPILQEVRNQEDHRWVSSDKKDRLWGVLVVHSCGEKRVWQDEEAEIVQQIADKLAIAIQQADLFKRLQQKQEKLTQTNEALALSNEDLARATRLKDEFLANMSHELRTPLTAILGMSEALQENTFGEINPGQEKAIKLIEKSGNHLLSLINDILDLSKIEAGKFELKLASTSIQNLCENSIIFVRQMAFTKNIELQTHIAENIDPIRVDELRIRQSLINLLSNAIKFTPPSGKVILSVELEEKEILFSVTDTGIGISSNDLNKLFQPFIQIDSSLNRQYAGTGLGLVLVERIITKHGGRVAVTSRVGEGSCFTLRLPYVPSPREFAPERLGTSSSSTSGINFPLTVSPLILLADDNEANRQTLEDYLTNKGYRILLAYNGREALGMAQNHQPDLILMDIQMPEMDGLEATKLIRSDPAIAHIPIIALTALALPGEADRCLAAGCDEYLAKPVRFKLLIETIQKFCQK